MQIYILSIGIYYYIYICYRNYYTDKKELKKSVCHN